MGKGSSHVWYYLRDLWIQVTVEERVHHKCTTFITRLEISVPTLSLTSWYPKHRVDGRSDTTSLIHRLQRTRQTQTSTDDTRVLAPRGHLDLKTLNVPSVYLGTVVRNGCDPNGPTTESSSRTNGYGSTGFIG